MMPIPDSGRNNRRQRRLPGRDLLAWLNAQRRRPGKGPSGGFVPVEPNGPNTLSGGAAAVPDIAQSGTTADR